jgi:Subtilase family
MDSIEVQHSISSAATRWALLTALALALCSPAAAAGAVSPLPASDYGVRPVCTAPALGHAGCLALALVPTTGSGALPAHTQLKRPLAATGASSSKTQAGPAGPLYAAGQKPEPLTPGELRSAYNLPTEPVSGSATQTIALVDAYNDPGAEADLEVYDSLPAIKLAECNAGDGCFRKVNQNGENAEEGASGTPFPKSAAELKEREATCEEPNQKAACVEVEEAVGWTVEISTDLDVAHSVCQSCHILLVEARSSSYEDLEAAEETAVNLGATEVSNSWGGSEPPFESPAFEHPGTVITAAAGDDGYLNWTEAAEAATNHEGYYVGADYPASSPHVVAVGGTELTVEAGARKSETAWNEDPDSGGDNEGAGGGGCSTQFAAPSWQLAVPNWASVGCGTGAEAKRAVADVAADADPSSGVLVYDSEESTKYFLEIGGTSVASPIVASVFALAGGAHGVAYPAQTLYSRLGSPAGFPSLYDVTEGGNGQCDGAYTSCSGSMSPLSPLDCGRGVLICNAAPGYDGPTGVGTPNGVAAFEPESAEEHARRVAAEAKAAEEKKTLEEQQKAKEAEQKLEEETQAAEARKVEEAIRAAEKLEEEEEAEEAAAARSGFGGGSTGKGSGGGETTSSGSGVGRILTGSGDGGLGGFPSGASSSSGGSARTPVRLSRLSRLALTARASAVIARRLPTLTQVAFAFTLSAPARVRVTLSRQIRVHGRLRWVSAPGALTLDVAAGRDRAHLRGRSALSPGRYRLTLSPAHGGARSIVFVLR